MRASLATSILFAVVVLGAESSGLAAPSAAASSAPSEIGDLDGLLARCAKMPGLSARFTEEKQIALLALPLRSEGTLHFARGRGLVRHTLAPARQSVLVTDKELVIWDGKATRRVGLGSGAAFESFVQAFSFLLAANRPALESRFAIGFVAGDAASGWSLRLVPKAEDLKKLISAIELSGKGLAISTLIVREATGDVSTTRFSAVDVTKQYSTGEADQLFRVPPTG